MGHRLWTLPGNQISVGNEISHLSIAHRQQELPWEGSGEPQPPQQQEVTPVQSCRVRAWLWQGAIPTGGDRDGALLAGWWRWDTQRPDLTAFLLWHPPLSSPKCPLFSQDLHKIQSSTSPSASSQFKKWFYIIQVNTELQQYWNPSASPSHCCANSSLNLEQPRPEREWPNIFHREFSDSNYFKPFYNLKKNKKIKDCQHEHRLTITMSEGHWKQSVWGQADISPLI